MTKSIDLHAVDLAARGEIIRWANERIESHRNKLEDLKCDERTTTVLRARIRELRQLVSELEGKKHEVV